MTEYNTVTLVNYRYCQRMWVAALRSICKPWILLCFRNSNCCHIGFLGSIKRKGVVDWNTGWSLLSNSYAASHNNVYKLEKTGLLLKFHTLWLCTWHNPKTPHSQFNIFPYIKLIIWKMKFKLKKLSLNGQRKVGSDS